MPSNKQRSPITFRLNPEQEQKIRDNAKKQGVTLSQLIKNSLLGAIDNESRIAA